jgi:hypothetical protein
VKWTLYAILYLIGVLTIGLLLMGAEHTTLAALNLVFLVIAVVLFRFALKDVKSTGPSPPATSLCRLQAPCSA